MTELVSHPDLGDAALQAAWTQLVAADPHATIFHTPRYLGVWQRILGTAEEVTTRTLHDGPDLVAVVVEARLREGSASGPVETLRFAGGNEVTDYLGPVARPDAVDEFVKAWTPGLARLRDFERAELGGLADDTGWPDRLAEGIEAAGGTITQRQRDDVCPVVDLSDGYEAYLASLPGKRRQEQKRKARKLSRDLGDVSIDEVGADELEQGLEVFFEMVADADSHKAGFFRRDVMRDFFRALADEFHADGTFRLHVLSVGTRPAAATVSLVHGDRWGLFNSAFDPVLGKFAPGMVLVADLVRRAAEEGLTSLDLLRGDEPYKYRFGATDRPLTRLDLDS